MIRSIRDDLVRIEPTSPRKACPSCDGAARWSIRSCRTHSSGLSCCLVRPCGRRSDTVGSKEGSLLVKFVGIDRLATQ